MSLLSYVFKLFSAGSASLLCPSDPRDGLSEDPIRVGDVLSRLVVITVGDGDDDTDATLVAGVCPPRSRTHIADHTGGLEVDRATSPTQDRKLT